MGMDVLALAETERLLAGDEWGADEGAWREYHAAALRLLAEVRHLQAALRIAQMARQRDVARLSRERDLWRGKWQRELGAPRVSA